MKRWRSCVAGWRDWKSYSRGKARSGVAGPVMARLGLARQGMGFKGVWQIPGSSPGHLRMAWHVTALQGQAPQGMVPQLLSQELGLFQFRMMVPRSPWLPLPSPCQVMPAAARLRSCPSDSRRLPKRRSPSGRVLLRLHHSV